MNILKARKLTELSLLTAVSLIIFVIELRLPGIIPVPGVKAGLANIITVYALYNYTFAETFMILFVRILLGSVFCGNVSAIIYSISGAVMCMAGMSLLKKIINIDHIWVASMAGAVLHNTGQLIAASVVMRTSAVFAYYPVLIVSGCIAGCFTGICAIIIIKRMRKTLDKS